MMYKQLEIAGNVDALGETAEFTWDLFPVVDPKLTTHLNEDGLPKVGTLILPGMILVGKIGKSSLYDPNHQPSPLQIHGLPFEELQRQFAHMWEDTSLYADSETIGIVQDAYFCQSPTGKRAVVIIAPRTLEKTPPTQHKR